MINRSPESRSRLYFSIRVCGHVLRCRLEYTSLAAMPVILEPGGTSWTLEHREGVGNGRRQDRASEGIRRVSWSVTFRRSACGRLRNLKDWEAERTDPILNAFAKYASVPIINLESAMHHPVSGDGGYDDDPRKAWDTKRKRCC